MVNCWIWSLAAERATGVATVHPASRMIERLTRRMACPFSEPSTTTSYLACMPSILYLRQNLRKDIARLCPILRSITHAPDPTVEVVLAAPIR